MTINISGTIKYAIDLNNKVLYILYLSSIGISAKRDAFSYIFSTLGPIGIICIADNNNIKLEYSGVIIPQNTNVHGQIIIVYN